MTSRQFFHRIKAKKSWAQRIVELQELLENNRANKFGAGRKRAKINDDVYPLLKAEMDKLADTGGDTSKKTQCSLYRKIAKKLGYKKEDLPIEVMNRRMQRFDDVLNFSRRAINQKKANRKDNYDLDRLSRYIKDVMRKNIVYACDMVEA